MELNSDSVTWKEPHTASRHVSGGNAVNTVFGFPVEENQFQVLHSDQPAESQRQEQREEGLVDPKTTRRLRWAARGTEDSRAKSVEAASAIVSVYSSAQGILNSEQCIQPVAAESSSPFFNSFSASPSDTFPLQSIGPVHYVLDFGVVGGDSLYGDLKCNKRISNAGQEWSGGDRAIRPLGVMLHA